MFSFFSSFFFISYLYPQTLKTDRHTSTDMEVTNEQLMEKLDKIESMLSTISKEEEKELKELDETVNLEFNNIEDWRKYIWDSCPFKKEKSEGEEMDFFCKKQDAPCKFDGCPLNKKIESN